jgi:hypothetical protein
VASRSRLGSRVVVGARCGGVGCDKGKHMSELELHTQYGVWSVWNDKLWTGPMSHASAVQMVREIREKYPDDEAAWFVVSRKITDWEAHR